jgi:nitroreductase
VLLVVRVLTKSAIIQITTNNVNRFRCRPERIIAIPAYVVRAAWSEGNAFLRLQNFLLALTERGIGSCIQVSLAGYLDIVRNQLSVPAELTLLCGMSIGYTDPDYPMNKVRAPRQPIQNNVRFFGYVSGNTRLFGLPFEASHSSDMLTPG